MNDQEYDEFNMIVARGFSVDDSKGQFVSLADFSLESKLDFSICVKPTATNVPEGEYFNPHMPVLVTINMVIGKPLVRDMMNPDQAKLLERLEAKLRANDPRPGRSEAQQGDFHESWRKDLDVPVQEAEIEGFAKISWKQVDGQTLFRVHSPDDEQKLFYVQGGGMTNKTLLSVSSSRVFQQILDEPKQDNSTRKVAVHSYGG